MKYTAGQAAKATGVATATITRALKNGRISGVKDGNGSWMIDPVELHRVFPFQQPLPNEKGETPFTKQRATPEKPYELVVLERELETLRNALADARHDRDKWQDMAERLLLSPPQKISNKRETGFWARLFYQK